MGEGDFFRGVPHGRQPILEWMVPHYVHMGSSTDWIWWVIEKKKTACEVGREMGWEGDLRGVRGKYDENTLYARVRPSEEIQIFLNI